MQQHIKTILVLFLLTAFSHAQEKDSIGTQTVNIVKPYTPTLSDAFKIMENPISNDSIIAEKKAINYTIFSVPVASTFVPVTGDPLKMEVLNKETLYNSYVSLELGNYTTALFDFYTSKLLEKGKSLDIGLFHHSSQGGIKEVSLDDVFFNSSLDVAYTKTDRDMDWKIKGGFQHQLYNWYGIYDSGAFNQNTLNSIEEQQNYYNAHVGTSLTLRDSFFKEGDFSFRHFRDAFHSAESRVAAKTSLEFPLAGELINTKVRFDYVTGDFSREYLSETPVSYSNLIAAINPNLLILRDNIKVNLGAMAVYTSDDGTGERDFFIYPQVSASYNIVKDNFIVYGGLEGELVQNTYYDLVSRNPFVSPTLQIIPTNKQYDAYLGFKGKFTPKLSYHIKGTYTTENNKPLLQLNPVANNGNGEAYSYGNSFGLVYDKVETLSVSGGLNIDIDTNLTLGINAEFSDYKTDEQPEAWNLPTIKGSLAARYTMGENWFGSTNLFYMGERRDFLDGEGILEPSVIEVGGYVDLNTHIGYRFNNRLSAFAKANNIFDIAYARWAAYPVQGFQALVGVSYQFDL